MPRLTSFGPDIWLADGDVATVAGFRYPTRMAVVRLPDGGLWLWSPVAPDTGLATEVAALGEVRHLVSPTRSHHLHLAAWRDASPAARLHAAPGLAAKRPDLLPVAELGDVPDPGWSGALEQVLVPNRIAPEIVFLHRSSRTVLVCDLIQHFPPGWFGGWRDLVARADLMTAPRPDVPRKFRLALGRGPAVRAAVRRIRGWPAERLVIAHGPPVTTGADAALAHAFRWLRA